MTKRRLQRPSPQLATRNLQSVVLLIALLLAGCHSSPTTAPITFTSNPIPTSTPTLPPPSPDATAAAFLSAWKMDDYATMYARLSPASRAAIDAESFTRRYQNALSTAGVLTVTTHLQSALREDNQA
ncbi:MAG: hypothetical protein JSV36_08665, partial [Anaerolineae bacterium]